MVHVVDRKCAILVRGFFYQALKKLIVLRFFSLIGAFAGQSFHIIIFCDTKKADKKLFRRLGQLRYESAFKTTLEHQELTEINLFILFSLFIVVFIAATGRYELIGYYAEGIASLAHRLCYNHVVGSRLFRFPKQ